MATLINLIGEQPIPNLLPILYLKPDRTIILSTPTTENVAKRIQRLTDNCDKIIVDPYDIQRFKDSVRKHLDPKNNYLFNITGGTKIMSVALYEIAMECRSEVLYMQSEGNQSLLRSYIMGSNGIIVQKQVELPELINMKTYLMAHLFEYKENQIAQIPFDRGAVYEKVIADTLKQNNFEVACGVRPAGEGNQLEIDIVLRLKGTNNFGIAEIKIGDKAEEGPKKGIDQLALAGQREYLGTYTNRFLITSRRLSSPIKELARAHRITVIDEIEQNRNDDNLTNDAKSRIIERIKQKLL